MGKSCKLPFTPLNKISDFPLQKIHCDLWDLGPITWNQNYRYYALFCGCLHLVFMDFSTQMEIWLFFSCFLKFQRQVENKLNRKFKVFQCVEGGEFLSTTFFNHLNLYGIVKQISCPRTLDQNGVAERKHRHIMEIGLTMMFHANLPTKLWVDVFLAAIYLINRLPSSSLGITTPYEKVFNKAPNCSGLRVMGY